MQNGIEMIFDRRSAFAGRPPQQMFVLHRENAAARCDRTLITKLLDDTGYKSTPDTRHLCQLFRGHGEFAGIGAAHGREHRL